MKCYFCGSNAINSLGVREEKQLIECGGCGFISVFPLPDGEKYERIYSSDFYHVHIQREVGHVSYYDRFDSDYELAKLRLKNISFIRDVITQKGSLLDIGCSNGAFVTRAVEEGYIGVGTDLNPVVIDFAKAKGKGTFECVNVFKSPAPYKSNSFEVITLHDVFEHLVDPRNDLEKISKLLRVGGLLIIDIPDIECDGFINNCLEWKHIRPLEHIHYPRIFHMRAMLKFVGLKLSYIMFPIEGKVVYYGVKVY